MAPGETIEYIIVDASGKRHPEKAKAVALYALDDGYDIGKYTEMALKAAETLLFPFGYDAAKLKGLWCPPPLRRTGRATPGPAPSDTGQTDLFASPSTPPQETDGKHT